MTHQQAMDSPLARKAESILAELESAGLYQARAPARRPAERAHHGGARQRPARAPQPLRQQLSRPRRPSRDHRRGARRLRRATASAWRRSASSAAPRRCTSSSSGRSPHYLGKDDAILFAACFDANGGLFEALLGEDDAIISDALNHASIIDGIRLCKAKRYRYQNRDMNELEDAAEGGRPQRRAASR